MPKNTQNADGFQAYIKGLRDSESRLKELDREMAEVTSLEPLLARADDILNRFRGIGKEVEDLFKRKRYQDLKRILPSLPEQTQELEQLLTEVQRAECPNPELARRRPDLVWFCYNQMTSSNISEAMDRGRRLLQDIAAEKERLRQEELRRQQEIIWRQQQEQRRIEEKRQRKNELKREIAKLQKEISSQRLKAIGAMALGLVCIVVVIVAFHIKTWWGILAVLICFGPVIGLFSAGFECLSEWRDNKVFLKRSQEALAKLDKEK